MSPTNDPLSTDPSATSNNPGDQETAQHSLQSAHESALLARHFVELHTKLEQDYVWRDRKLRLSVALAGNVTLAVVSFLWADAKLVAICLAGVTAVLALWSAMHSWRDRTIDHSILRSEWSNLQSAWEGLERPPTEWGVWTSKAEVLAATEGRLRVRQAGSPTWHRDRRRVNR